MKPSWLIGNALKKCGVPCAYEIAMMLKAEPDEPVTPDVPESAMYLYGTPSTSGNIGLRVGESVTMYDGAVLPPLPEWDKSKYPYAFLCHLSGDSIVSGTDGGYHLHLLSEPCTYGGITSGYVGAGTVLTYHLVCSEELLEYCGMSGLWDMSGLVTEANKWFHVDTVSNDESAKVHGTFPNPVWSNFDICFTDGAVKLAAGSDTIPVSGLVGYSYNGTVLLELPEWGKTDYPYAVLWYNGSGTPYDTAHFWVFDNPVYYESEAESTNGKAGLNTASGAKYIGFRYWSNTVNTDSDSASWKQYGEGVTANGDIMSFRNVYNYLVWCNHDVCKTDGTVFMGASDPIPVYE